MTSYNPNIPQATDFLADSQLDIKNNFNQANTTFGVNHIAFNVAPDNGLHKWVQMPLVANYAAITPAPAASQDVVYSKTATSEAAGTETNLFMSPDASGNEYQLTRTVTGKFSSFGTTAANKGWTFLPGGLLLQYGFVNGTLSGGTSASITFPVAFTTGVFSLQTSLAYTTTAPSSTGGVGNVTFDTASLSTTGFTYTVITNSSAYKRFYWVAIGK